MLLLSLFSLVDWANYHSGSKKDKLHLGFNFNQGIFQKRFLIDDKYDDRPFVPDIIEPGQMDVMDRGQNHKYFVQLQTDNKHFVCRIKTSMQKTCLVVYPVAPGQSYFLQR